MQIIPYAELQPVPWANGGGITREIAVRRDADGLLWRLSLADVATEGPFSAFPAMRRILTVISGPGMILDTPDGPLAARPLVPLSFAGDLPVTGRLPDGPIRDLNVIFRPDRVAAYVALCTGCVRHDDADHSLRMVHIVASGARLGRRRLAPGTTVIAPDGPVIPDPGTAILAIAISPNST